MLLLVLCAVGPKWSLLLNPWPTVSDQKLAHQQNSDMKSLNLLHGKNLKGKMFKGLKMFKLDELRVKVCLECHQALLPPKQYCIVVKKQLCKWICGAADALCSRAKMIFTFKAIWPTVSDQKLTHQQSSWENSELKSLNLLHGKN